MIRAAESQRCMSGETAETAKAGGDTANRSHIVRSRVVSCSVLYGVCSHLTLGVRAGVGAVLSPVGADAWTATALSLSACQHLEHELDRPPISQQDDEDNMPEASSCS